MPTILLVNGWRFFFYSNEGNEPIHVHCQKGEKECKYWLDTELYELEEAYIYNMNNKDKRDVKEIIYTHFDIIEKEWHEFKIRSKK